MTRNRLVPLIIATVIGISVGPDLARKLRQPETERELGHAARGAACGVLVFLAALGISGWTEKYLGGQEEDPEAIPVLPATTTVLELLRSERDRMMSEIDQLKDDLERSRRIDMDQQLELGRSARDLRIVREEYLANQNRLIGAANVLFADEGYHDANQLQRFLDSASAARSVGAAETTIRELLEEKYGRLNNQPFWRALRPKSTGPALEMDLERPIDTEGLDAEGMDSGTPRDLEPPGPAGGPADGAHGLAGARAGAEVVA